MNKKEFINAVAHSADSTKTEAERYINAIINVLSDSIVKRRNHTVYRFRYFYH